MNTQQDKYEEAAKLYVLKHGTTIDEALRENEYLKKYIAYLQRKLRRANITFRSSI